MGVGSWRSGSTGLRRLTPHRGGERSHARPATPGRRTPMLHSGRHRLIYGIAPPTGNLRVGDVPDRRVTWLGWRRVARGG